MAPHGKELSEDLRIRIVALHKDGLDYEKFGNSLELSYITVVFQDVFHSEQASQGSITEVESLCCASGAEAGLKNRGMSAASIALEVAEVEGQLVSTQTIRHTLQQVGLHGVVQEGSLFWSWLTKNPAKSLLKTAWPRAWITGTISCGLMSLK